MSAAEMMLDQCACQRTRTAARAITRAYDAALRPTGLRATQVAVLAGAAARDVVSIAALAETLGMDRSTLTRALSTLARAGLVRVGDEGWRRSRSVRITAPGQAQLERALPLWSQAQAALREQLGDRGWSDTICMLDRLSMIDAPTH